MPFEEDEEGQKYTAYAVGDWTDYKIQKWVWKGTGVGYKFESSSSKAAWEPHTFPDISCKVSG